MMISNTMLQVLPNPHDKLLPEEISAFSKVFVKESFLSDELCESLKQEAQSLLHPAAKKHTFINIMSMNHCFLPIEHSIHNVLADVWDEAANHFNIDVSYVEPYKVQHYTEGSYFHRHIDNYHGLDQPDDRKLTMLVQLSDPSDYEGGKVVINTKPMSRTKGTVTIFPSFYPHFVELITKGDRYALVGWAWGPYWK